MKRVVFLGAKEIGYECLKFLYANRLECGIQLDGVLTNDRGKQIIQFCNDNGIRVIDNLEEMLEGDDFNIGISVQYHRILKKEHIEKAKDIMVNLHMAPLPEYRGCNQFSFAILNGDKQFGTTIHRLEEGIDSGAILFEKRFSISDKCWVDELYQITFRKSVELFKESLLNIVKGNYKPKPQSLFLNKRKTSLHYRKEIEALKEIDLSWPRDKIERHIRATYMPGFEPPHTVINGKIIYFTKEK